MIHLPRTTDPESAEHSAAADDALAVHSLPAGSTPLHVWQQLIDLPHCAFLDSAHRHHTLGRYSYVAADPFAWHTCSTDTPDPLAQLQNFLAPYQLPHIPQLPPFQGGAVMLIAYDLNQTLDAILPPATDDLQLPRISIGLYDVVLAFDHQTARAWLISTGLPEPDPDARRRRAVERRDRFLQLLARSAPDSPPPPPAARRPLQSPQYSTWGPSPLTSNFSKAGYLEAVAAAVAFVRAGDVFQVNLSQALTLPATRSSAALYQQLRLANPAPFAAYFDLGPEQILSSSPERFLQVTDRRVEARPIKGTRPRRDWPEADLHAAYDLQTSDKERSENVMIVDLMRNDLARVCLPDSLRVAQLCQIEHYAFVQHLVSSIHGQLTPQATLADLLRATFPGGSVTGAPKIRAMQIIRQLEQTARGAYCGSLGYCSFSGQLDLNILIRTVTAGGGWWRIPVGGGIVADSQPGLEYEETWHKATGMLRTLL